MEKLVTFVKIVFIFAFMAEHFFQLSTSQGKENPSRLKIPKNVLQQQNFHEPNRWRPPVRLIPFNVHQFNRVHPGEEDETASGSGSGLDTKPACDDEDGECGDKRDVVDVETGMSTSLPETTSVASSAVPKLYAALTTTPMVRHTNSLKPVSPVSKNGLGRTINASLDSSPSSKDLKSTIIPDFSTPLAKNESSSKTKSSTNKRGIPTSNKLNTTQSSREPARETTNKINNMNTNKSTNKVCIGRTCDGSQISDNIDMGTSTTQSSDISTLSTTKQTRPNLNYTISADYKRINREKTSTKTTLTPDNASTILPRDQKTLTTPFVRQTTTIFDTSNTQSSPTISRIKTVVSKITTKRNSLAYVTSWPRIYNKGVLRRNATTPNVTTPSTVDKVDIVMASSQLHPTMTALVSRRKEIYENFVEKSLSRPCRGLLCEAGGICLEHGKNQGKCLCPFEKRGKHCEKENNFTHPKFSGSSYLLLNKSINFGKDFNIMMEFRAEDPNGVLLYGTTLNENEDNFFAIILIDGYLQFRLKCGPGFMAISSSTKLNLLHWHRVIVRKFKNKVNIQSNGASITSSVGQCLENQIETSSLYLGGLPHDALQRRNVGLIDGFVGCIRKFSVNRNYYGLGLKKTNAFKGIDIADCTGGSCATNYCEVNSSCIPEGTNSSKCLCPVGVSGSSCTKEESILMPRFTGLGFLEFIGLGSSAWSAIEIEIVLKPKSDTGLILYNGDRIDGKGDFISLALKNGFVEFAYDCGTGAAIIRSLSKLSLNNWHVIRASRKGKFGFLQVNNDKEVRGSSRGPFQMLKLKKHLFIGGTKFFTDIPLIVGCHSHFHGCIEQILINKKKLNWSKSYGGHGVTNCDSHNCFAEQCSNQGRCESHKGATWCHCYLGYSGAHCERRTNITVPSFSGHSFLKFNNRKLFRHLANPTSVLSFTFRSHVKDGLLLWNGQKNVELRPSGDFLSLALENGYLICRYNLGDGEAILNSTKLLSDGKWHEIRLIRINGKGELNIDGVDSIKAAATGNYTMLNTDGELFIGGAENIVVTTRSNHLQGFSGCMKNLKIGIKDIDLINDAALGHNIAKCV